MIPWDQVPHDDGRPRLYLGPPQVVARERMPELPGVPSFRLTGGVGDILGYLLLRAPGLGVLVDRLAAVLEAPESVLIMVHDDLEVGDVPASRAAWHCDGLHGVASEHAIWQSGVAPTLFLDGDQELRAGEQPRVWECPQETIVRYTGQHLHSAQPAKLVGSRVFVRLSTMPARYRINDAPITRLDRR